MFEEDMSPRLLNVERLERKFASLTRSRESIQGLSMWIIRHKEFYKEIVDQWFDALKRDFNTLNMFYVANDVIQNCARKKAPEYRDAFATVLDKAVSLDKIKEIKSEVTRMISLWQDREIYGDIFFKKLEQKLNEEVETDESEVEVELSEEEVIANFKLENLINSLRKLKTLEDELSEKQSFLEDIEEPVISNLDNLIVRMESQKEIRKIDKYQNLVQDFLNLTEKVIAAEKSVMLDLKYSSIFYNAQNEDAKKVAHAYRIYGKKVKNVEKSVLEKLLSFPEPSPVPSPTTSFPSPILECDTSPKSTPNISASPFKNENEESVSNVFIKTEKEGSVSNIYIENEKEVIIPNAVFKADKEEIVCNVNSAGEKEEIVLNVSSEAEKEEMVSNLSSKAEKDEIASNLSSKAEKEEIVSNLSSKAEREEIVSDVSCKVKKEEIVPIVSLKSEREECTSKAFKIVKEESVSNVGFKVEKIESVSNVGFKTENKGSISNVCIKDEKCQKPEKEITANILNEKCKNASEKKPCLPSPDSEIKNLDAEKISSFDEITGETPNSLEGSLNEAMNLVEDAATSKSANPSTVKNTPNADIHDDIDFLLEKAYHVQVKSKTNFKRKIDNLLKLKQSKSCKLASIEDDVKISEENKILQEPSESAVHASVSANESISNDSKSDSRSSPVPMDIVTTDKQSETTGDMNELHKSEQPDVEMVQPIESTPSVETPSLSDSPLESKNFSTPNLFGFQTFLDIPTELLKNILDKNKVNMNIPSNADMSNSCNQEANATSEKLNEDESKCSNNSDNMLPLNENLQETLAENTNIVGGDIKDSVECKESTSEADNVLTNINPPNFSESLFNVLRCFTKKEISPQELNSPKALNHSPSMPLENTLKVYNCLMQCYGKDYVLKEPSFNSVSTQEEMPKSERSVLENPNVQERNSVKEEALMQNDNLEIMDMDVDSDDD